MKTLLPFVTVWGEGNYPAGPEVYAGTPTRVNPGTRFLTPFTRGAAAFVNFPLWESQEAARRCATEALVKDIENGSMYSSGNASHWALTYDRYSGTFLLGTSESANQTNVYMWPSRLRPTESMGGTLGTTGSARALGVGNPGAHYRYVYRHSGGTPSAIRWNVSAASVSPCTFVGVGALSTGEADWLERQDQGAGANGQYLAVCSTASPVGMRIWQFDGANVAATASWDVTSPVGQIFRPIFAQIPGGIAMCATGFGHTGVGTPGATNIRIARSQALGAPPWGAANLPDLTGIVEPEIIGLFADHTGRIVVCVVDRDGVNRWQFWETTDGVVWTALTGVDDQPWFGTTVADNPIRNRFGGALKPIRVRAYGHLWLAVLGREGTATALLAYSSDRGATWAISHNWVTGVTNLPTNMRFGAAIPNAPDVAVGPMGLMLCGHTATITGGVQNALYHGQAGGLRGPELF